MAGSGDLPFDAAVDFPAEVRSRTRFRVLAFGVALAGITYLDRVCISKTADAIMGDLGLSKVQMGFVFSAFTLAYALFEIPTGAWADRIGTRRVLTRIVAWWSTFTIATAAAFNYASLVLIRFLFGAGEAGAFPSMARTFSRWFPTTERGTAQGVFFAGAHLAGGLTPLLVTQLMTVMHWRSIFVLFGAIGFVWAAAWYVWFRDEPAQHPAVSREELTHIEKGRRPEAAHHLDAAILWRIASDRNLAVLCLMYFTQAYGFYFFITWLPTYLAQVRGFSGNQLGLLAGLPLILSAPADLLGGWTTDRVTRRYGLRAGRCGVGGLALLVAGVAMIAGATTENALASALLIGLAGGASNFLLGSCWGVCLDIAGPYGGMISACMNTAGQVGGALNPVIVSLFLHGSAGDWTAPLCLSGGLYLLGALCWWFIDPERPSFGVKPEGLGEVP